MHSFRKSKMRFATMADREVFPLRLKRMRNCRINRFVSSCIPSLLLLDSDLDRTAGTWTGGLSDPDSEGSPAHHRCGHGIGSRKHSIGMDRPRRSIKAVRPAQSRHSDFQPGQRSALVMVGLPAPPSASQPVPLSTGALAALLHGEFRRFSFQSHCGSFHERESVGVDRNVRFLAGAVTLGCRSSCSHRSIPVWRWCWDHGLWATSPFRIFLRSVAANTPGSSLRPAAPSAARLSTP